MNDKERLEKIKEKVNSLLYLGDNEGNGEVNINAIYNDMSWLIEQAEKAEKYREVLEFYADESIYSARNKERAEITLDYGEKARKALEGKNDITKIPCMGL